MSGIERGREEGEVGCSLGLDDVVDQSPHSPRFDARTMAAHKREATFEGSSGIWIKRGRDELEP